MTRNDGIVRIYRDQHHRLAELVAMGVEPSKIRRMTGVSGRRLRLLCADPSFQALIAEKSKIIMEKYEENAEPWAEVSFSNLIQSELQIQDRLDAYHDDPDSGASLQMLNKIAMDRADRLGYGKKATIRHEFDFADALDKAIARSGKMLESKPAPMPTLVLESAQQVVEVEPTAVDAPVARPRSLVDALEPVAGRPVSPPLVVSPAPVRKMRRLGQAA